MELTRDQQRAIAIARARVRARQAQASAPQHPEFDGSNVPGYNPKTGEVAPQYGRVGSFLRGAADAVTLGWGDELASGVGSLITGQPRNQVQTEMRSLDQAAQSQNPGSYLLGQVGGGVAQGMVAGPGIMASAPTLLGRAAGGAATGAAFGGTYGAGSGETAQDRVVEALKGAGIGGVVGGAFPLVTAGAGRVYQSARDALSAGPTARQAGASPEALRMLGGVMQADDSLGPRGVANMTRAGQEAMLADAGPTAQSMLDTAIQKAGPGARMANDRVGQRVTRDSAALVNAMDQSLGAPEGITAARTAIREGSAGARSAAYNQAYEAPIDYASQGGMALEDIIRTRVPGSVINEANRLMQLEGLQSRQILARVADDGSVVYERLPDVRQIDYITRALNQAAESGDGAGALGGQTTLGRAYQGLSRDIRGRLRDMVPEYAQALDTAADPIRRSQAVELGSRLLSPSMARDQVAEAVEGMSQAERQAVMQGVRSRIDDVMAQVTRTVADDDVSAREALKGLKDLSSRANREKLAMVLGDEPAQQLFAELDRAAQSFNLRANVATNSRTFGRQAMSQRVADMTEPGVIGTLAQGKPINAAQRIAQALTGQTPQRLKSREDAVYAEIADLLTRQGGAGQGVYDAINRIGQTDAATQLMADRIVRSGVSPRLSYPSTLLIEDRLQRQ